MRLFQAVNYLSAFGRQGQHSCTVSGGNVNIHVYNIGGVEGLGDWENQHSCTVSGGNVNIHVKIGGNVNTRYSVGGNVNTRYSVGGTYIG